ncbi:MAG: hypothetical protein WBK48_03675 [Dethiobacteria bacterium]
MLAATRHFYSEEGPEQGAARAASWWRRFPPGGPPAATLISYGLHPSGRVCFMTFTASPPLVLHALHEFCALFPGEDWIPVTAEAIPGFKKAKPLESIFKAGGKLRRRRDRHLMERAWEEVGLAVREVHLKIEQRKGLGLR